MSRSVTPLWLRVLAVCSAVVLAGGYVAYRSQRAGAAIKAATGSSSNQPDPIEESQDEVMTADSGETGRKGPNKRVVLPSSKMGGIVVPDVANEPSEALEQRLKKRTVLPSSKSIDSILNFQGTDEIEER